METWDALRSRRNVREFSPTPVSEEDMATILEAGRPRAVGEELAAVGLRAGDRPRSAPRPHRGLAGRVARRRRRGCDRDRRTESSGRSLGRAPAVRPRSRDDADDARRGRPRDRHVPLVLQDQELARKILGFPEGHFLAYLVSLGYPADGPLRPLRRLNRRPFDEVVHHGRW